MSEQAPALTTRQLKKLANVVTRSLRVHLPTGRGIRVGSGPVEHNEVRGVDTYVGDVEFGPRWTRLAVAAGKALAESIIAGGYTCVYSPLDYKTPGLQHYYDTPIRLLVQWQDPAGYPCPSGRIEPADPYWSFRIDVRVAP